MSQHSIQAKQGGEPAISSSSGTISSDRSTPPKRERAESSSRVSPELKEVADLIGGFIEYWGFKSIHGRIWTHLFTSKRPLDATTLVKRLKVSKALVSFAVRDLLEYEVIQEVSRGPRGTVLFRANPDLAGVISGVIRRRERPMLSRIRSASERLESIPKDAREGGELDADRLQYLAELTRAAEAFLELALSMTRTSGHQENASASDPRNADLLDQLLRLQPERKD